MRATDRPSLEPSVDGLQRLVRRARGPLVFAVITVLTLVVLIACATLPDAAILGIYSAEDGDDTSLDEALRPTSTPPLRVTDARTPLWEDCWSARVARMLMTVRDRAPPGRALPDASRFLRLLRSPSALSFLSSSPCAAVTHDPQSDKEGL